MEGMEDTGAMEVAAAITISRTQTTASLIFTTEEAKEDREEGREEQEEEEEVTEAGIKEREMEGIDQEASTTRSVKRANWRRTQTSSCKRNSKKISISKAT